MIFPLDNTKLLRYLLLWKSHIVQHSLAILKSDKSHVKGSTSIVVHFKQCKPGVDLPWKNNIVWSYNRLTLYSLWNSDKLYTLQLKMQVCKNQCWFVCYQIRQWNLHSKHFDMKVVVETGFFLDLKFDLRMMDI